MQAECGELRRGFGECRLTPESLDDLWHLSHLIVPGSLVFATTFRSVETATDRLRPEKPEKRPVRLGIRVERVEFHASAARLRIAGPIEHGPELGSYHTINLEPYTEVSVVRSWRPTDLERVERAVRASVFGAVHVLALEEGEAELYRVRQFGPEFVGGVTAGSAKGDEGGGRRAFFERVQDLVRLLEGALVVAGPGFVKEEFIAFLKESLPDLAGRTTIVDTRRIGRGAVQDAIGQGVLERLAGDRELAREVNLMEEVMRRIATDGAVAYGINETRRAVEYGAAEQV
ncbi:MAG TPA: mRNA surveillance protein pelota, partial [Methanoregulaceae archaeon]|nr:mRNA surveillance protein pelota [Methanoregulaceae archaeon]